jgi:hypothetical protein
MVDHLQKSIFDIMKTHDRVNKYNAMWLSVPAYNHVLLKTMSHQEVAQWSWKEMKERSQYQLGVATQPVQGRIAT